MKQFLIQSKIYLIIGATTFLSRCVEMEVVVPNGYTGQVCLVKSNVKENELVLDSNGIGYINESTFNSLKFKPIVQDILGKDLSENCVGFNPTAFWGIGKSQSSESKKVINYVCFEIVPDSLKGKKQYYTKDLFKLVDTLKIK